MPFSVLDSGINFVLFAQKLGTWLEQPMLFFSFLGSEEFYLLIASAIYWCISARTGLRVGLYLSISAGINAIFKLLFHVPRPYWYDRRVSALSSETSFGNPSGHSQNAVVVWGSLAASSGKTWAWAAAVVIIILISFSRIYLGVHFAVDVIGGWLIGAILLWALLKFETPVLRWLDGQNLVSRIAVVFLVSVSLIALAAIARLMLAGWELPAEWIENARAADPSAEPINPFALEGIISNAAIFFGLAVGGIWIYERGGFVTRGTWWQLGLRYLVGLIGVLVLWRGLGLIFPDGETAIPIILRYIRYALVGVWVSGLAPLLFIKLRLSAPKR